MPKLSELIDPGLKAVMADTEEARRSALLLAARIRQSGESMGLVVVEVGVKRPSQQGMWKTTFPFPAGGAEVMRVAVGCRAFSQWVQIAREHALWLAWVLVVTPEPLTPEAEKASYWLQASAGRRRGRGRKGED